MKKFLILFLFPLFAYGAIPKTAEGWYMPEAGFSPFVIQSAWYVQGGKVIQCFVDENNGVPLIGWEGTPPKEPDKTAIETALQAYSLGEYNAESIQTLGKNLNKVFNTEGIQITGKTPDGSVQSFTIKFKNSIGDESGIIQAESDHMSWNLADGSSLEMLKGNKLQLKGWNQYNSATPLYLVKVNGMLGYVPQSLVYELSCSNKWESLSKWIEGCMFANDSLTFTHSSLYDYAKSLGFVYSTKKDSSMYFDNSDDNITASFGAPVNWVDNESLSYINGKFQIKDFATATKCNAPLTRMLTDKGDSERNTHLFLAKETSTGSLHYVPIGEAIKYEIKVDEKSISIDEETEELELAGFASAADGTYPVSIGGELQWLPTNKIVQATASSFGNFAYNPETRTIASGAYCIGRTYYKVAGVSIGEGFTGSVSLCVNISGTNAEICIGVSGFGQPTAYESYVPLYEFRDGKIVNDYRGAPVIQAWEEL